MRSWSIVYMFMFNRPQKRGSVRQDLCFELNRTSLGDRNERTAMSHGQRVARESNQIGKMGTVKLTIRLAALAILVSLAGFLGSRVRSGSSSLWNSGTAKKMYKKVVLFKAETYDENERPLFAIQESSIDQLMFPNPHIIQPMKELLKAPWVAKLKGNLNNVTGRQVNVVVANSKYLPNVLNWLVAALIRAAPPLENVLIFALDEPLHSFLQEKDLPSVYVNPWSVISLNASLVGAYSHIWVVRLTVFRFLNYLGYDVANYDTDAVVLKNLQPLFNKYWDSDVIGSAGTFPLKLGRKWGQTFCMGMSLFRSTKETDLLWYAMAQVKQNVSDDQVKMNYALDWCNITWIKEQGGLATQGQCREGPKVTILSTKVICRHCSKDKVADYYVWHKLAKKGNIAKKMVAAEFGNAWFLREDWNTTSSTGLSHGINWLQSIAHITVL